MSFRPTRVCPIREELVALTGNLHQAVILNQLLYWTQRCHDFDEMLAEENERRETMERAPVNMKPFHGWIRKSYTDLSQETMLGVSKETIRRHVGPLLERHWLETRPSAASSWDKTPEYRVNLIQLSKDLGELGYTIPGFTFEGVKDTPNQTFNTEKSSKTVAKPRESSTSQKSTMHVTKSCDQRHEMRPLKDKDYTKTTYNKTLKEDDVTFSDLVKDAVDVGMTCTSHPLEEIQETPSTPSKATKNQALAAQEPRKSASTAEAMIGVWERVVEGQTGLIRLKNDRQTQLETFLQDFCAGSLEKFKAYCERITTSNFLMGEVDKPNPWRLTLDAALEAGKAEKIFEGAYGIGDRKAAPRIAAPEVEPVIDLEEASQTPQEATFRQEILKEVGAKSYVSWFKNLALEEAGEGIRIVVPSRYLLQEIENRFEAPFSRACARAFGDQQVALVQGRV